MEIEPERSSDQDDLSEETLVLLEHPDKPERADLNQLADGTFDLQDEEAFHSKPSGPAMEKVDRRACVPDGTGREFYQSRVPPYVDWNVVCCEDHSEG